MEEIPTIGELRARLTLHRPVSITNTRGGKDITWEIAGKIWGKVTPEDGLPHQYTDNPTNAVTHRIVCRANPMVTRKMRLSNGDIYYHINTIINLDEGNLRYYELLVAQQDDEV